MDDSAVGSLTGRDIKSAAYRIKAESAKTRGVHCRRFSLSYGRKLGLVADEHHPASASRIDITDHLPEKAFATPLRIGNKRSLVNYEKSVGVFIFRKIPRRT
jgi:hypothetical protein